MHVSLYDLNYIEYVTRNFKKNNTAMIVWMLFFSIIDKFPPNTVKQTLSSLNWEQVENPHRQPLPTRVYSVGSSKCEKLASLVAWQDHNTIVETNLRTLTGTWISKGCETRPGPEYVLRSYTFNSDGNYNLIQHHYWDDSCSSPKLTIITIGRIQLRNTLIQLDACNGVPKPINISVIPQDDRAAEELDRIVASECPGQLWKSFRRNEQHIVYDNRNDRRSVYNLWSQFYQPVSNNHALNTPTHISSGYISCLGSLKWAFNELKLMKIQFRPTIFDQYRKHHVKQMEMELLLGDIHSNKKRREFYTPSSFQMPLLRQTKGENFTINKHQFLIKNSNMLPTNLVTNFMSPPHLTEKPHLPPYIWGEWISTRCESRPSDVFLVRRFAFYENSKKWVGEHKFYSDPYCKTTKFTVTATGHLTLDSNNQMKGIMNIDFHIEEAVLKPIDVSVITDMRLGFCGTGEWRVNITKELSPSNGCAHLGILIPSTRYDIVKIEIDYNGAWLLFLGQEDTNNLPNVANERPTAFQLPLTKCGDAPELMPPLTSVWERRYYFNSCKNLESLKMLIIVTNIFIFYCTC